MAHIQPLAVTAEHGLDADLLRSTREAATSNELKASPLAELRPLEMLSLPDEYLEPSRLGIQFAPGLMGGTLKLRECAPSPGSGSGGVDLPAAAIASSDLWFDQPAAQIDFCGEVRRPRPCSPSPPWEGPLYQSAM